MHVRLTVLETRFENHVEQQKDLMAKISDLSKSLGELAVEMKGTAKALTWMGPVLLATVAFIGWVFERILK